MQTVKFTFYVGPRVSGLQVPGFAIFVPGLTITGRLLAELPAESRTSCLLQPSLLPSPNRC